MKKKNCECYNILHNKQEYSHIFFFNIHTDFKEYITHEKQYDYEARKNHKYYEKTTNIMKKPQILHNIAHNICNFF